MPRIELDPALIGGGNAFGAYQNALADGLKMRASQQVVDDNQFKMDNVREDRNQQNALAQLLANQNFDAKSALGQSQMYGAGGVKNTQAYNKSIADIAETGAKAGKELAGTRKIDLENYLQKFDIMDRLMSPVKDQASYDAMKVQASQNPLFANMVQHMPPEYDPAKMAAGRMQSMSIKEKIAAELAQTIATETGRHNLAGETETSKNNIDLSKDRRLTREQADSHYNLTRNDGLNAPQYMETDAGLVALPKRPLAGKAPVGVPVMGANGQPLGKPLKDIPVSVNSAMVQNQQSTGAIDRSLTLLGGGNVGGMMGDKNATGMKGYLHNGILNYFDPEGVSTRAEISDIGSLKIHDRSGAAVTISESPRLMPFIPLITDDAVAVKKKLERLKVELVNESGAMNQIYSKEQGYKPSPLQAGKLASNQDSAAMAWAKSNPSDPRAAKILQHLGQ